MPHIWLKYFAIFKTVKFKNGKWKYNNFFLTYHSRLRICLIFETGFNMLLVMFNVLSLYIFYYLSS